LNFVYADVDGNIGYFAPVALPVRPRHDGTLPVPGWTGEYEWAGFVPVEQLPRIYNPSRGFVVTANNPALPEEYPHVISTNWEPGYRAARITQLLEESSQASMETVAHVHADVRTPQVRVLLPWMQRVDLRDEAHRAALERLRRWDGAFAPDSPEAALFMAWTNELTEELFADELGPDLFHDWAQWPSWRVKAIDGIVSRSDDRWCDRADTPPVEACAEVLRTSLDRALAELAARQRTTDPGRWRWQEDNPVTFGHAPFQAVGFLRPFFSRRVSVGGSGTTVNPVMRAPQADFIASYRQILDLADFDRSRVVNPPGQSGQLFSGHYADQLEPWRRVEYVPLPFSRAAVDATATSRLVLEP
jgi:penicillin amidase